MGLGRAALGRRQWAALPDLFGRRPIPPASRQGGGRYSREKSPVVRSLLAGPFQLDWGSCGSSFWYSWTTVGCG